MPLRDRETPDSTERYDVCVIGGGLTASVLALELARAGLAVVWVDGDGAAARPTSACEYVGHPDYPARLAKPPRTWSGGTLERLPRSDFRSHPYSGGAPWPLGAGDLEPHYAAVEALLRDDGHEDVVGLHALEADAEADERLRGFGIDGVALARPPAAHDADLRTRIARDARASACCRVLRGAIATRLRADINGRITGVVARLADGATQTLYADSVVVAAGAIGSARLLLASRSAHHREGLGNEHGLVGRYVHDQAVVIAVGETGPGPNRWPTAARPIHTAQFHQAFRRANLGAVHPYFGAVKPRDLERHFGDAFARLRAACASLRGQRIGIECRVEIRPSARNRVTLSPHAFDGHGAPLARLHFACSPEDVELIQRTRTWAEKWLERIGASRRIESRVAWAGVIGGTARIGADPRASVCDAALRVHSSPNLFMCGAPVMPRSSALPPTLTACALAHRLASHLAARARWLARGRAFDRRARGPAPDSNPHSVPRARP